MDKIKFSRKLKEEAENISIELNEKQLEAFYDYMKLLIEWNEKINLTAIVDPEEIITKHFVDSLTALKYIEESNSVVDIGTGAGFPGIPIKIANRNINMTLVDSLNKRINFLNEVISKNDLVNIEAIHCRAEEFGKNIKYREKYDIAISRAVARLNVLVEYLLPTIKVGGKCICMKGPDSEEEVNEAEKAIEILGGKLEKIECFVLPGTDIKRSIIIINKIKNTPNQYPRKAGMPAKNPIK
ncbi:MAG: 16S rRNA (guanine(527)-N(7))-methyltransferase RsmG [Clostridia bacterium]|nr:16S rRNA (guanine(527)-N(7))-methyltransferase RsmG [Clostridia bacterium]